MASSVAAGARLDRATLTVSCFPTCGEATVTRRVPLSRQDRLRSLDALNIASRGIRGAAIDPERSERESLARTRRAVRRWCSHHRTTRLATLTFAVEPADLDEAWEHVEHFRRRLVDAGIAQPLIVPEWGTQNGRIHFHAAMPSYVPKAELEKLWGQGFVDIRKLRPKPRPGGPRPGAREQARLCAGYVAGYVAKGHGSAGTHAGPGLNRRRYSIPKGTVPEPVTFMCWTMYEVWAEIERQCGHLMHQVWASPVDSEEWRGPPTLLLMG